MSGSPLRPDRDSFGPTYVDSTAVRDPRRQVAAAAFNLLCWQSAGQGLVVPRAFLTFEGEASPAVLTRAESWNPQRLNSGQYANPTITVTGAGNYLVEYPTPVLDELGAEQALSFADAAAFLSGGDAAVLKHARAAVVAANQVRVCVYTSAGVKEHGNDLLLLIW